MKILVVSQRYWPESFRINSICEAFVKMGHDVTVLTGLPNYPKGDIYPGYKNKSKRRENINGVKIIRVYEIPRKKGFVFRFLNYISFEFFANKYIKKLPSDFDLVLANELSPINSCVPAIKYKKRNKTKIIMYEMDLWPESLKAGGIKVRNPIFRIYKRISRKIYSSFDHIFVSTKEHIEYIKRLTKKDDLSISYLPQPSEDVFFNIKKNERNDGIFRILFAGNCGKAQDLFTVLRIANRLKDNNIVFDIVGDGSELNALKKFAKDNDIFNVIFHGYKKIEDVIPFYANADAAIVSLTDDSYCQMTIPGKVQTYVAASLPIISLCKGATNSFIKENELGLVIDSKDHKECSLILLNWIKYKNKCHISDNKKIKLSIQSFIKTILKF